MYLLLPAVDHPEHTVTTREILDDLHRAHPGHPRRALFDRLAATVGVDTRRYAIPLEVAAAQASLPARTAMAWNWIRSGGAEAARQTLKEHDVDPREVDVLVTVAATGDAKPGLDVALVQDLGLRPTVRRLAMTGYACAGGVVALSRATDLLRAHGGRTALVVAAEALSTVYHHSDISAGSVVFKYLFGDSAAAALVTSDRPGDRPSLEILDTYEMVLPDSEDYYRQRLEPDGWHFDSTKAAMSAVAEVMPDVVDWLRAGDPGWAPGHVIAHPGGMKIINSVQAGLGCPPDRLRFSMESMKDGGNRGGPAVLDVARRAMSSGELVDGSTGLAVSFGPGFVTAALRTRAHVPA